MEREKLYSRLRAPAHVIRSYVLQNMDAMQPEHTLDTGPERFASVRRWGHTPPLPLPCTHQPRRPLTGLCVPAGGSPLARRLRTSDARTRRGDPAAGGSQACAPAPGAPGRPPPARPAGHHPAPVVLREACARSWACGPSCTAGAPLLPLSSPGAARWGVRRPPGRPSCPCTSLDPPTGPGGAWRGARQR